MLTYNPLVKERQTATSEAFCFVVEPSEGAGEIHDAEPAQAGESAALPTLNKSALEGGWAENIAGAALGPGRG